MTLFFGTSDVNQDNHLMIGGCDVLTLTKKYGTPLIVYDVAYIRKQAQSFKETLNALGIKNKVIYASKAFCCMAMYQLLVEENIGCDVVSSGEIYTALKSGMPANEIEFHGNNKTEEELLFAVENRVGTIVVDNFDEIRLLQEILQKKKTKTRNIVSDYTRN